MEDCSRVADHVHCDTMVVAVSPIDTLPPVTNNMSSTFHFVSDFRKLKQMKNSNGMEVLKRTCVECCVQVVCVVVDMFPDQLERLQKNKR